MACFLVPAGEAVITTVVQKVFERNEKKSGGGKSAVIGPKWSQRLGWLNKMLWGGTLLLALEHVWHGEVVPWWPFLTAMNNPEDIGPMLNEMALFGTTMAVTVTVIWGIMVWVAELKSRPAAGAKAEPAGGA